MICLQGHLSQYKFKDEVQIDLNDSHKEDDGADYGVRGPRRGEQRPKQQVTYRTIANEQECRKQKAKHVIDKPTEPTIEVPPTAPNNTLPWGLLALSWIGFVAYVFWQRS